MTAWLPEVLRALAFTLEVNILGLGFVAVGILVALVVVLPFTVGAAAWETRHRASFQRWGPVVGLILALLAMLVLPAYGAAANDPTSVKSLLPSRAKSFGWAREHCYALGMAAPAPVKQATDRLSARLPVPSSGGPI